MINRREFITIAAASLLTPSLEMKGQIRGTGGRPWYTEMLQCGQININERDAATLDIETWMDFELSLKVDAVILNGGGIDCYYPTKVPFHRHYKFMGTRDLFGDMSAAARKRKLRVIARMDPNYAYEEAFEAHPEWFQRKTDGSPKRYEESPWLYRTCMFSTYYTEQFPAILREIGANYIPDAIYTNGWPSVDALEVCHCVNCQKIYEQIGGVPPETTDSRSIVYRRYYKVYMDRIAEVWKLWTSIAKAANPDSTYVGNFGESIWTVKDMKTLGDNADWFNADNQGRRPGRPIWVCAQQGRLAKSVMGDRPITNVVAAFAYESNELTWQNSSKAPAEQTMWMAQIAASGMIPWLTWLGGAPEDTRWHEPSRLFFDWHAANRPHFRNKRSLADVAVLYPQRTISFYQSDGTPDRKLGDLKIEPTDYIQGLYTALVEGHIFFDFVHQHTLSAETLKPYRALLIPNAAYLRDEECEAIRSYVKGGGSVLATFETSRYNEWGELREDFDLKDIFGVSVANEVIGPYDNSYVRIDKPHPVLDGFTGTKMMPGAEFRVPVSHLTAEERYLSVIPHYPPFPVAMIYPRISHSDEPAAVFREDGGRVVYFPGDICRSYYLSGNPDFSRLIINSVHWLLRDQHPAVTVEGDGVIDIFAWETEPGFAVHLLNYTNPNMTRPYITKFYPIGPLKVRFRVPNDKKIASAKALRSDHTIVFKQTANTVEFEVPTVLDYEVIALI